MRHLVLLASAYALVCALVLPGSILAQEEPATTTAPAGTTPTETAPAPPPPAPDPQVLAEDTDEVAPAPPKKVFAAASGGVTIADFSFSPASLTINQGDTVTWVNNGPTPHSATANNGSFNTGILKAGQSGSHTFNQAGTFTYYCQPHPFMKGTIVVRAAQTPSDTGGGGSSEAGAAPAAPAAPATAAQAAGDGPTLPNTGGAAAPLLILGGLMLLLGLAVHRRTA
jgi:LPXTG-motif cell wall-anchored protein